MNFESNFEIWNKIKKYSEKNIEIIILKRLRRIYF